MKEKSLISYGIKNIPFYLICAVFVYLQVNLSLKAPALLSEIVDKVIGDGDVSVFPLLLIEMVLCYLFCGLCDYVQEYVSDYLSRRTCNNIRKDVFNSISEKDGDFFSSHSAAELMSRTTSDTDNVGFMFGFCGVFFAQIIYMIIATFIALLKLNFYLSLVPIITMPLVGTLAIISEFKGDKMADKISDDRAELNRTVSEALTGIRTVKSFGKEKEEEDKFSKKATYFSLLNRKFDIHWSRWNTREGYISLITLPLSLLVSGYLVIKGKLTLGELTLAVQYTTQLSWPMMEIGWILGQVSYARAGWRKIKSIFNYEPKIKDGTESTESFGDISFKNVSIIKNGKKVLDDISFEIPKGKVVALMGSSGSGKSLITSLCMRMMDADEGEVCINGKNVKDLKIESVRSFSSIVTQDVFLFSDSVKNNISLGHRKSVNDEEIKRVCKEAKADEFIENLENGYDTIIGERGVGLSGGQKQRLSIARAFMKKSQLLILDDATSSLDMETEREIEEIIRKKKGLSLLITAHRISAVNMADEIIVLDKGRIVERGKHEELLKKKGLYYETYISQYGEVDETKL